MQLEIEHAPAQAPHPKTEPSYDFLTVATFYVTRLGWPVFPLRGMTPDGRCTCGKDECPSSPGKHPASPHGKNDATLDLEMLDMMAHQYQCSGWATVTGWVTPTKVIVIDIDGEEGEESVRWLDSQFLTLPPTVEARSGSGGRHLYYQAVHGVKTVASQLAPRIDVRADKGQIILPPTLHKSGLRYEWVRDPLKHKIMPLPTWIPKQLAFVKAQKAAERDAKYRDRYAAMTGDPGPAPQGGYEPEAADLVTSYNPETGEVGAVASFAEAYDVRYGAPVSEADLQAAAPPPAEEPRKMSISERATAHLRPAGQGPAPHHSQDNRINQGYRSREERLAAWRADPDRARDRLQMFAHEVATLGPKSRQRNDTLNRNAYIGFKIARDANLPEREVIHAFVEAGKACGLLLPEVLSTLRSAQMGSRAP